VRKHVALLLLAGSGLAVAGTALAQGGRDELRIHMQRGCLETKRVTVRIVPPDGTILSPVHIRAGNFESVHLDGVSGEARVILRVPRRVRVIVSGETTDGRRFSASRDYRPCAPPRPAPRNLGPVTGGGEG
jgi:hypothetical protein